MCAAAEQATLLTAHDEREAQRRVPLGEARRSAARLRSDRLEVAMTTLDKVQSSVRRYMRLGSYVTAGFDRGRPPWLEAVWQVVQILLVGSPFSCSALRVGVLRLFGAKIGRGVRIKPGIRVKFPWRLQIGNDCWI